MSNTPKVKSTPASGTATPSVRGEIKVREWVSLNTADEEAAGEPTLKIMTWNMLAQTLVRRDLFPTSDCLKASQREGMLTKEILTYNPDIACLQEVDRLDKHLPILTKAGYNHTYASGPKKLHGCMIIHKAALFEKVSEDTVFYDDFDLSTILPNAGAEGPRLGSTRSTRNIGLVVALQRKDGSGRGCVVATTHTFWHPKYIYERARQVGILLQTVRRIQDEDERYKSWPAYLAGDFNTQPTEATYALLTGNPLTPQHLKALDTSRIIHMSRDPTVTPSGDKRAKEDEGAATAEGDDPDKVIKDARRATPEDGLLSDEELLQLFGDARLRSGCDEAFANVPTAEQGSLFGTREPSVVVGKYEPMYTSYTYFWKLTLDYIFIVDPSSGEVSLPRIVGVLRGHQESDMAPGLPQQGICGSDHVALMLELTNGG